MHLLPGTWPLLIPFRGSAANPSNLEKIDISIKSKKFHKQGRPLHSYVHSEMLSLKRQQKFRICCLLQKIFMDHLSALIGTEISQTSRISLLVIPLIKLSVNWLGKIQQTTRPKPQIIGIGTIIDSNHVKFKHKQDLFMWDMNFTPRNFNVCLCWIDSLDVEVFVYVLMI